MKEFLKYKGFLGSIDISLEDNCIHGKILFIDDLVTYEAESPKQLQKEFEAAVEDYLATCKELGRSPNKPFSGSFNIRIGPVQHQMIARFACARNLSINEVVKRAIIEYLERPDKENEVVHRHYHTVEYKTDFNIHIDEQVMPWGKKPTLRIVN